MPSEQSVVSSPVSVTDEVYEAARAVVEAWPESQDFPAMARLRNAFRARDALFARMVEALSNDEPTPIISGSSTKETDS